MAPPSAVMRARSSASLMTTRPGRGPSARGDKALAGYGKPRRRRDGRLARGIRADSHAVTRRAGRAVGLDDICVMARGADGAAQRFSSSPAAVGGDLDRVARPRRRAVDPWRGGRAGGVRRPGVLPRRRLAISLLGRLLSRTRGGLVGSLARGGRRVRLLRDLLGRRRTGLV